MYVNLFNNIIRSNYKAIFSETLRIIKQAKKDKDEWTRKRNKMT